MGQASIVSKNEKSPDDSEKPDKNMLKGDGKDAQAGKFSLLQVPIKRTYSEDTLNIANINSPQAGNNNRDRENIQKEASGTENTENENTEYENIDLPYMKFKIENRKTKPVLKTVQLKNLSPETGTKKDTINKFVSENPPFIEATGTQKPTYSEEIEDLGPNPSIYSEVALEPKLVDSAETAPEKKVELIPEAEKKGKNSNKTSSKNKKIHRKTKIKKKSGFTENMKDLGRDIVGIEEGEKLSDKLKKFFGEVKTPEGAKKKFAEIIRSLKDEDIRVLPPYDPETCGPLLEYEIPAGFTEIERYWVEEPYAFISIIENVEMKYYYAVEPTLTTYEKAVLERVRDNLEDVLTQEDIISRQEKDVSLINRSMRLLDQYYSTLEVSSIHKIMYFLRRNFIGYERINPLIRDPNIEDISCSGIEIPIYLFHQKYNNIVTNVHLGEKELDSLVVKLCQRSGKHISIGEPIVDATLPDGSRIQATLGKEITTRGSSYTIRKFKGDPITPIDLIRYGTCSMEMMAYYWIAIENNISVLLAGGTASGKTSLMNAISLFIPRLSKVVSIEDTREIMLHHENWIAGATRKSFTVDGTGEVSMYELLTAALRQRPEYIIVGEVRGKEALTLFQAMSTGHTTYSTMHASDVQTVVNRLENEPINVPHVMMQALGVISIQIQTYVNEKRVRRTNTIVEITGLDARSGSLRINEFYRWDPLQDIFKRAGDSYVLNEIMKARGWKPEKLFIEFKNREQILAHLTTKQIRDYVSVSLIVHMYATNPQLVMEAIGNDTLSDMILHYT
ncbi:MULTISPECIES: type II/IV secretion system ATPase subunit [unclassified Methanosarcina]|uniref:type II/IV secretion system ATPase subunit n=1 Tax=unclassified Methanosarcina TaxID=2644672 RepID=UPI000615B83A|nr:MULTISPECIES: type II/IV secretion system ATPase subunit [unclassified Methanosarcina]AKB19125.1 Flagella-related protein FlaI [Methanosarcina sp. WWM596]AKB23045.1 Flagella-related protein FlaI [Methanosarcina sp. WH1]